MTAFSLKLRKSVMPHRLITTQQAALSAPAGSGSPPTRAPIPVYLLADNLDAALATGEDLTRCAVIWNAVPGPDQDIASLRAHQRNAINGIRTLEMLLAARILKARERSAEFAERFRRFEPLARVFGGGTAILHDMADDIAKAGALNFATGDTQLTYLRSRGLVAEDSAGPSPGTHLQVTEDLKIGGLIRLGELLDMVAGYLDALDVYFELYPDDGTTSDTDEAEAEATVDIIASETALSRPAVFASDLDEALAEIRATREDVPHSQKPDPGIFDQIDDTAGALEVDPAPNIVAPSIATADDVTDNRPSATRSIADELEAALIAEATSTPDSALPIEPTTPFSTVDTVTASPFIETDLTAAATEPASAIDFSTRLRASDVAEVIAVDDPMLASAEATPDSPIETAAIVLEEADPTPAAKSRRARRKRRTQY